jgi:hypothetical protein
MYYYNPTEANNRSENIMGRVYSDADRILSMLKMNPNERAHSAQSMANENRNPTQKKGVMGNSRKSKAR